MIHEGLLEHGDRYLPTLVLPLANDMAARDHGDVNCSQSILLEAVAKNSLQLTVYPSREGADVAF